MTKEIDTTTTQDDLPDTGKSPVYRRDKVTGLIENVIYARKPNGAINWREMIGYQHIVFNSRVKNLEELYGAPATKLIYSEVIKDHKVPDEHILIKLNGFIEVAELRGYAAVQQDIPYASDTNATAVCHITWLPNEEEAYSKTSSGSADATFENTGGFGYLAAMAGNRAFVRAVKNGLGIFVLGFDEIAKKDSPIAEPATTSSSIDPFSPQGALQKAANDLKVPFVQIKEGAIERYRDKVDGDPTTWTSFADVKPKDCMTLIGLLKKAAQAAT